ncbi:hypothetical protein LshimejAT787_0506800 [Lyophyllum shimeji]|uniref:Crinkler effector protein N-terminal domain-containing protein n=1 Tax=Lyophyllum shimeji TaxID=47721 RepID=A0A9P3UPB4_LYOSH|nr:hypothetical protein LshimejAT787_0506800 [Lyophyllum shimeji]
MPGRVLSAAQIDVGSNSPADEGGRSVRCLFLRTMDRRAPGPVSLFNVLNDCGPPQATYQEGNKSYTRSREHINAAHLELFKASIPVDDDSDRLAARFENLTLNEKPLNPLKKLSKVFQDLSEEHIHVIVRVPVTLLHPVSRQREPPRGTSERTDSPSRRSETPVVPTPPTLAPTFPAPGSEEFTAYVAELIARAVAHLLQSRPGGMLSPTPVVAPSSPALSVEVHTGGNEGTNPDSSESDHSEEGEIANPTACRRKRHRAGRARTQAAIRRAKENGTYDESRRGGFGCAGR